MQRLGPGWATDKLHRGADCRTNICQDGIYVANDFCVLQARHCRMGLDDPLATNTAPHRRVQCLAFTLADSPCEV
jgi:hypothetical protein